MWLFCGKDDNALIAIVDVYFIFHSKSGDEILAVNGRSKRQLTVSYVQDLLTGGDDELVLIVRRNGDTHQTNAEEDHEDVMLNGSTHGFHNYGYEVSVSFVVLFFTRLGT